MKKKKKKKGVLELTSARKEKAERSSEIGAAMAMNLLFLISLSNVTLSFSVVKAPPPEAAVTIDSLLLKELGREAVRMEEEMRRRRWWQKWVRFRLKQLPTSCMCCLCGGAGDFLPFFFLRFSVFGRKLIDYKMVHFLSLKRSNLFFPFPFKK